MPGGLYPNFDDPSAKIFGCNASDFSEGDFEGKIALVSRGFCLFEEKINNTAAAGGVGILVFNNVEGLVTMAINSMIIYI